jgi:putative hydrolase
MTPVEALTRAIYLLDRSMAERGRISAFVRARDVVVELGEDQIADVVRRGELYDIAGIGTSTGGVIEAAVHDVPSLYLAKLESETTIEVGEGAELRAALRGDCHSHTTWTDGGAPVREMALAAQALGHEYLVVTDHSERLRVANGLTESRLREQLAEIAMVNMELAPFRVLSGLEVDILENGRLDLGDHILSQLDIVVASVHHKLTMGSLDMTRRLVMAIANPNVDILGHCTGRKVKPHKGASGKGRKPSSFDAELVFAACATYDTAVEINCRPERQDPPEDLLEQAIAWGAKVAINTDAHAPGQLEWQPYGCDKAARCGIEADSVVNTMDADDLLAWAASHPEP